MENTNRPVQPWPVFECGGGSTVGMRVSTGDGRFFELIYQPANNRWLELRFPGGEVKGFDFISGEELWKPKV